MLERSMRDLQISMERSAALETMSGALRIWDSPSDGREAQEQSRRWDAET
jgi:hypothetical protein